MEHRPHQSDQRGAAMAEYALLATLICVACVTAVLLLGQGVAADFLLP